MNIFQQSFKSIVLTLLVLIPASVFATTAAGGEGKVNTKKEVEDYILHHIQDSHDFSLFSYTNGQGERVHVGFPLPVILWSSEGLVTFMSSEFHHNDNGSVIVEKNGLKFAKIHSKIYELDQGATSR